MTPSSRDSFSGPNAESHPDNLSQNGKAKTGTKKDSLDSIEFQSFLIDQLAKVQEQNEDLLARIKRLEKEQEEFYISGQKKMETGFKNVKKCTEDVAAMKEVFKEIVGIMTGERVRFIDHAQESITDGDAQRVSSSSLLASNSRQETRARVRQSISDVAALNGIPEFKVEESEVYSGFLSPDIYDDTRRSNNGQQRVFGMGSSEQTQNNGGDSDGNEDVQNNETNSHDLWIPTDSGGTPHVDSATSLSMDSIPNYRMNRAIQSVHDVAREYFEGFPGRPSLMFLERRYGSTWRRSSKERTLFAKRMCIIHKINDIRDNPKKYELPERIHRNQAIKVVENIRLGNNNFKGHNCRLSISQLYTYFSKKMDTLQDYSLELKKRGEPRRNHLMRERMARLERTNAGSESIPTIANHSE
ncbi:hypothetical protein HG535_0D02980 [Zygotorulaspora mrakii]|uniref:Transcription activator GCR1-like domain-containing protein n=1 Tax=Zygotorulaspora mrakii TaxID=42260 RepID=A0A7H9B1U2_ZYGMR|nr:uncharacterized protein HG535_0D02980 [Zygotorulaspora mrakii]QLG72590.1 hypothetical protein HG535_0D02980 [Zygotorulaspora mrakii]